MSTSSSTAVSSESDSSSRKRRKESSSRHRISKHKKIEKLDKDNVDKKSKDNVAEDVPAKKHSHMNDSESGDKTAKKAKKDKKKKKKEKKGKKSKKEKKDKSKDKDKDKSDKKSKKNKKDKQLKSDDIDVKEPVTAPISEPLLASTDWDIEEKSKLGLSDDLLDDNVMMASAALVLDQDVQESEKQAPVNNVVLENTDNNNMVEKSEPVVDKRSLLHLSIYDDLDLGENQNVDENQFESSNVVDSHNDGDDDCERVQTPPLPMTTTSTTPVLIEDRKETMLKDRKPKEKLKVKLNHLLDDESEESGVSADLTSESNGGNSCTKRVDTEDILLLFDKDITDSIDKNLSNNKSTWYVYFRISSILYLKKKLS